MIKDEHYYVVHGWMRNRLNLKGNDLIVYALIYGFSQDGESEFKGSVDYIKDFTGASRNTIRLSLNRLEELGFITKNSRNKESGQTNAYTCIPLEEIGKEGGSLKQATPYTKIGYGVAQNEPRGSLKQATIINSYKETYIESDNSKQVSKKVIKKELQSYDELLDDFGVQGFYREAVFKFIAHLKTSFGLVMLNDRLESLIVKLDMAYREDREKIKAIDEAIVNGYKRLGVEEYA